MILITFTKVLTKNHVIIPNVNVFLDTNLVWSNTNVSWRKLSASYVLIIIASSHKSHAKKHTVCSRSPCKRSNKKQRPNEETEFIFELTLRSYTHFQIKKHINSTYCRSTVLCRSIMRFIEMLHFICFLWPVLSKKWFPRYQMWTLVFENAYCPIYTAPLQSTICAFSAAFLIWIRVCNPMFMNEPVFVVDAQREKPRG